MKEKLHPILSNYLKKYVTLTPKDIQYICSHFSKSKVKRNEIVINNTEICDGYYFINKGALRIYAINGKGKEISRYFAFEKMFCTALPSFINQEPTREFMQAIQSSDLLFIKREDFFKLTKHYSEFDAIYRKILSDGFITAQKRIYGFQGFTALEKVHWIIKDQPKFLLRVSNKMAASYLGISPSTLSRAKAKL